MFCLQKTKRYMEKTIVQFILENIFLFFPLGVLGIISTIVLFFISKKDSTTEPENLESDFRKIFKIRINIYVLIYLFIWIMISIIGFLSNYIIPTAIGAIIAAIPLILLKIVEFKTKNVKVR